MSLSRAEIRSRLLLRIPKLGGKRTAQEIDADGIIDASAFNRNESGTGDYRGAIIYLPNATDTDQLREAGFTDGPKLKQTGADYPSGLDLDYELYYLLHPYAVNDAIRRAPHECYGETSVPLTMWPDGDFSASDVTHWSSGTIVAPTKSTDTKYKFVSNQRTLMVPASGGNLYAQSDDIFVSEGDQFFHGAVGAVEESSSGTAYYALWDQTHNVAIYTNTFSAYRDQVINRTDAIPLGCQRVALRLGAMANGCTTVWKATMSHFPGAGSSPVQSWLKEQMNFLGFGPARYNRQTGTDRFNAGDRVVEEWSDHNNYDFSLMPYVPESDNYTLQVHRPGGLTGRDFWIHGYRRMSEFDGELNSEDATTEIDEELIMSAVEKLVCAQLGPEYQGQYIEAAKKLDAQRIARTVVQPKFVRGYARMALMGGPRGNNRSIGWR